MDELGFRSSDGIDVSYRRWQAEGEPKAAVLVAHGMSEHSGRYQRLANALTAAGYAVYDPDHRLKNPGGLEADLSQKRPELTVEVVIVPTP